MPIWRLDTNTVTVTRFNPNTLAMESKTYHTDFIRYHLHYSDRKNHDSLRKLVNEGKIIQYLDDLELKVGEAILRQAGFINRPTAAIRAVPSGAAVIFVQTFLWIGQSFIDGQIKDDAHISIVFDQSPLVDENAERQRDKDDVLAGLMQKWEYRVKWYGK